MSARTVNIHEAKTTFSKLVEAARDGETIVIAKAGAPVAKLTRLGAPEHAVSRLGFLSGQATIPDDFDAWAADEIAAGFGMGPVA
ncbi:type II toxin-antitoxin system Phd/YefM family antitoxin [Agromyces archimandritae]|uniref:Antitoxin n=1 Tax=Agromyces archimandritae TaxID=2781962 RepID=A0A975FP02_9MICO|nr:type II toxin-antitoxin system prevent-host-death family antitoxin [Agromyces archimandritae]QTX05958.1 type II toxin-antitoxin system Phd/YefM family antitoxin [Agromyces archimandritae]